MRAKTKEEIRQWRAERRNVLEELRDKNPPPPPKAAAAKPATAQARKTTTTRTRKTTRAQEPAKCGTRSGYNRHRNNGEEPCADCRAANTRKARTKEAARCGTRSGYDRHRRNDEDPCPECRAANAARETARNRRNGAKARPPTPECGTPGGATAHYRRGETPCEDCRQARNARQRGVLPASAANLNGKPPAKCGTISGNARHRRLGETPCQECRDAANAAQRRNYHRNRAAQKAQGRQPPTPGPKCGTHQGYQRHARRNELSCPECAEATRAHHRQRNARRRAEREAHGKKPPTTRTSCGTEGGYSAHYRNNEFPCPDCRAAHNETTRQYRAKQRAAK